MLDTCSFGWRHATSASGSEKVFQLRTTYDHISLAVHDLLYFDSMLFIKFQIISLHRVLIWLTTKLSLFYMRTFVRNWYLILGSDFPVFRWFIYLVQDALLNIFDQTSKNARFCAYEKNVPTLPPQKSKIFKNLPRDSFR